MLNILSAGLLDEIGSAVSDQFSNTISTTELLLSFLAAIVGALIINYTYKKTYVGVSYSKTNSLSIILLTLVTTVVIRAINSNLSLSLGMVGALSIVRFRTAIKDPVDTIFMFWSITVGILAGAGLYVVAVISSIIISIIYYLSFFVQTKKTKKMLLVISCTTEKSKKIYDMLKSKKNCALKTELYKDKNAELTYEVSQRKIIDDVLCMSDDTDVKSINVIDID